MRTGEWAGSDSHSADAVVIGGGTVGGWCAYWLRQAGLERVAVVERSTLGRGASSRAAGMVRSQGGTPAAVQLGMWSRDFYLRQGEELGVDSGFVAQGYFMPAFDAEAVSVGRARVAMQQGLGLEVEWLEPDEAAAHNPTLAAGSYLGGSYAAGDGYLDPPRNVLAYSVALARSGVRLMERTAFTGLVLAGGAAIGVETSAGRISTECVVLTGGPDLASVGRLAGVTVHAGGTRHQVAVTEAHAAFSPEAMGAMVFDLPAGLYWRPEEGGLLFGMSNPDEPPGEAREIDWPYLETMRARLSRLVPLSAGLSLRRAWAATIDYTPDHLPIFGPALGRDGPLRNVTVASAGGHGMMWGPAVARVAADLAVSGATSVIDDVGSYGLDRFDAEGNSRLDPDPIALPFPERTAR
ncbi:MAG: NAD(P)/FAD-dependent oxidoreductase [Acidimicrobiales bacterium]|jgi:sarcosine oxidase, subunit beta